MLFIYLFFVCCIFSRLLAMDKFQNDEGIQEEIGFAIRELSKLSDSGVYTTLSLSKIIAAKREEGLYHHNTILTLSLQSPHFASEKEEEAFEIIVMTHKEDGIKSIAINEFPVMSESAIESFYMKKVTQKTRTREESFRRLEIEAVLSARSGVNFSQDEEEAAALRIKEEIRQKSIASLLDGLDSEELREKRNSASMKVQLQLPTRYADEEIELMSLSLGRLYNITIGEYPASSFMKNRAIDILDSFLSEL